MIHKLFLFEKCMFAGTNISLKWCFLNPHHLGYEENINVFSANYSHFATRQLLAFGIMDDCEYLRLFYIGTSLDLSSMRLTDSIDAFVFPFKHYSQDIFNVTLSYKYFTHVYLPQTLMWLNWQSIACLFH